MLSYQHAYHAGNFADVHKHAVLCLLLGALIRKEKPFFVLDAFAGRGTYSLQGEEAEKTGEYSHGIGRMWQSEGAPESLHAYLEAVRQFNSGPSLLRYPGSPWLIRHAMRDQDRLALCEQHPAEFEALRRNMRSHRNVALHQRDGFEAMSALLPPRERRGLLLVDPSYEVKSEYLTVANAVARVFRHWREGMYAIWYPILAAGNHEKLRAALVQSGIRNILDCSIMVAPSVAGGMTGSGMIVVHPPWKLKESLESLLPWLCAKLGERGGGWRVHWLVPE